MAHGKKIYVLKCKKCNRIFNLYYEGAWKFKALMGIYETHTKICTGADEIPID